MTYTTSRTCIINENEILYLMLHKTVITIKQTVINYECDSYKVDQKNINASYAIKFDNKVWAG